MYLKKHALVNGIIRIKQKSNCDYPLVPFSKMKRKERKDRRGEEMNANLKRGRN
jgi:hypothetical protein